MSKFDLKLQNITKVYPGVVALSDVSLEISAGEIVGLIGENGAGKSTLMKVLGGVIAPSSGEIVLNGQSFDQLTPAIATEMGIAFVHQELNPFTNLDVTANILLGREVTTGPFFRLDRKNMVELVRPILKLVGARFGPDDMVSELSLAEQQLLEIARALSMNARLVILDEPTSSLTLSETERLMAVIEGLRKRGAAILFISHRLAEIESCADRVVVLRDGQNAGALPKSDIQKSTMVRMMIGRSLTKVSEKRRHQFGEAVLDIRGAGTIAFPAACADLSVRSGEILGLAGLVGAGRTELMRAVFGIEALEHGEILLNGSRISGGSVSEVLEHGLCLVPEDRKDAGLILDFTISENVALPNLNLVSRRGVVDGKKVVQLAEKAKDQLAIKSASLNNEAAELSGGNQQKIVLAKWLAMQPKIIIFDEPTRGVDVGAKAEIYRLMYDLAAQGVAILMISSDMEEIIGVSDRVAVMHAGEITGILNADELSEHSVLSLAVG